MFTRQGLVLGFKRLIGIALSVIPFGFAFGSAAVAAGLSPAAAIGMSALVFAGASQFAVLELWQHPLPYVSMVLVAFAVNLRHVVFGAALTPLVSDLRGIKRFIALGLLSDANFADMQAARREGQNDIGILVGGGLALWSCWVAGTALGAIVGSGIGDPSRFGLDVLMAAFFVTVIVSSVRRSGPWLALGAAAFVAVLTLPILPSGWNVMAGAAVGGLIGAFHAPRT